MVNKGSIIKVDYEAWTSEGTLFDTTHKEVAKANNSYNEEVVYEPLPVVVGVGRVIPGFDRALQEANVGEEKEIVIPAKDAFGERDPSKFETLSLREFQKREVNPYPGMRFQSEGRTGTVVSVTPGRVRVDFNSPLAGKDLRYKFKIVEEVSDQVEKVKTLIDLNYGQGRSGGFGVTVNGTEVDMKLPDSCKYDQRWFIAKYRLVADLRNHAGFKTMRFVEEYDTPEAQATPAATGSEGANRELVEEEML
ncbi:MAG TPA: peptidylprolyl isomerase [Candidatus Thermoplasmatota archaeon]|nr:peptidylprolyl isomerase [Candidatus Thermoplasmatota archaeon]